MSTWNTFGSGILPHLRSTSPALSLRQPGKMDPPSEDPLASVDFIAEFLPPAIDFGEGFWFDEPFYFGDSGDGLSVMPPAVHCLMAHTTTLPALSLSRAVCSSFTATVVVSNAVLIASTARKALSCPVGTGIFSGLG